MTARPEDAELEVLEAIRREISRAAPPGTRQGDREWAIEATRLILEARRERDAALVHAGYEEWKAEFDALSRVRKLEKMADEWQGWARRFEAEVQTLRHQLTLEDMVPDLKARIAELEGKLSQAVAHGMDWGRARIAQLEAERDAALARVRELELEKGGATWDCDVLGHAERIAQLEAERGQWQDMSRAVRNLQAEGAANARLREAFDAAAWGFRQSCEDCRENEDIVKELRAALANEPKP